MKIRKYLANSQQYGGGNFDESKLAFRLHALYKGRLASFFGMVLAVLFVFLGFCSLSSCSSDKEEEAPNQNYQPILTSHNWEISSASERIKGLLVDVKDADAYCRFSSDSIYFTEVEEVNTFDEEGKITQTEYKETSCGNYPYTIKAQEIKINNQFFNIKGADTNTFVLENEGWRIVLKNK